MPGVRDVLNRFRPVGAPGAATAVGVPADRRESAADELRPVFAALDEVVHRCDVLRREAAAEADRQRHDAAERAQAVVARAQADSEMERASAAAAARREVEISAEGTLRRAAAEAVEVRRAGEAIRPELVESALQQARADLWAFARRGHGDL